jgi:hypothetical protein
MKVLTCRIKNHSGRFYFKQYPYGPSYTIVPEDMVRLTTIESKAIRKIIRVKYEMNNKEKTFFEVDIE